MKREKIARNCPPVRVSWDTYEALKKLVALETERSEMGSFSISGIADALLSKAIKAAEEEITGAARLEGCRKGKTGDIHERLQVLEELVQQLQSKRDGGASSSYLNELPDPVQPYTKRS